MCLTWNWRYCLLPQKFRFLGAKTEKTYLFGKMTQKESNWHQNTSFGALRVKPTFSGWAVNALETLKNHARWQLHPYPHATPLFGRLPILACGVSCWTWSTLPNFNSIGSRVSEPQEVKYRHFPLTWDIALTTMYALSCYTVITSLFYIDHDIDICELSLII